MQRPGEPAFTSEEEAVIKLADEIQKMQSLPAWTWFAEKLRTVVFEAQNDALHASTVDQSAAVDALRQWQMKDETVSSILGLLSDAIQRRDDLLAKENYGRSDNGDPEGGPRTSY